MDKKIIDSFKELAVQNLRTSIQQNGSFMPVAIIPEAHFILGLSWDDDEQKSRLFKMIGSVCRHKNTPEILIITDSYMRSIEPKNFKYVMENYDTEAPSTYPPSMRSEVLVFSIYNLKEEGQDRVILLKYTKKNNEPVFEPEEDSLSGEGGIKMCLKEGWINPIPADQLPGPK